MRGSKEDQDGGLATAKRIMERLANTPPKPQKDAKGDELPPERPRRRRPKKASEN